MGVRRVRKPDQDLRKFTEIRGLCLLEVGVSSPAMYVCSYSARAWYGALDPRNEMLNF